MIPFDTTTAVHHFAAMVDDGIMLVVVDDNDNPVGMMGCVISPYTYNPAYTCCSELMFWIEPEHRGGSAATRLLKQAEVRAKEAGAHFMIMVALETSPEGIEDYYKKLGYSRTERTYVKGVG